MWPEHQPNDQIGFDHFFECLAKWSVQQEKLDYEDFAAAEEEKASASADFQKITGAVL